MWRKCLHGFDAIEDGLAHDEHSGATTERLVVNLSAFTGGIIAKVMQLDIDESAFDGFFEMSLTEVAVEHFGEEGEDVELHVILRHRILP